MRIVFVVSNSVGLKHEQLKRSKKMRWRLFGFNLIPAGGGDPSPPVVFNLKSFGLISDFS